MNTLTKTLICSLLAVSFGAAAAEVVPLWDKHCASCHGKDGVGNTRMGKQSGVKDYTDAKVQAEMKDDTAFTSVKNGITEKGKERMKPFKDKLTDDEIKALVAHMRTFKK